MGIFSGKNTATSIIKVNYDGKQAESGLGRLNGSLGKSAKSVALTAAAFAGLTIAMVKTKQAMDFAVDSAVKFEAAGSRLKAILKPTKDEFNALERQAEQLGKTTVFTATQVMEAFTEMGKLGFKTNEILASGNEVLSLAALAQTDMATAATVTVQTLNQFQLAAEESNRVVDVIAKSFTSSALDITKFSEAMKFVGPIAGTTNEQLEDVTGALAVLADNAIDASLAGTAMRRILLELANENSKASKVISKTGIATETLADKMRVLRDLNIDATETTRLFGLRATTGAQILIKNADAVEELADEFRNANGAAKEMAETMLDNVEGASIRLKSAQEALALSIREFTLPAMRAMKEFLIDITLGWEFLIRSMTGADRKQQERMEELNKQLELEKEIVNTYENYPQIMAAAANSMRGLKITKPTLESYEQAKKNVEELVTQLKAAAGVTDPKTKKPVTGGGTSNGLSEQEIKAREKEAKAMKKLQDSFDKEILRMKEAAHGESIAEIKKEAAEMEELQGFFNDNILRMKEEANNKDNEMRREAADKEIKDAEELEERKRQAFQDTVNFASSLTNTLMSISDARTQNELENLEKQNLSEAQYEKKKEKILEESREKRRAFARIQQGIAIGEATIDAIKAGTGAAADTPGGVITRGLAMAAAIANGMLQVGLIQEQNFQTGKFGQKKRNRSGDSIPAMIDPGETIVPAPQSAAHEETLRAIMNNTANTAMGVTQTGGGGNNYTFVNPSEEQVLNIITQSKRTNSTGLLL